MCSEFLSKLLFKFLRCVRPVDGLGLLVVKGDELVESGFEIRR